MRRLNVVMPLAGTIMGCVGQPYDPNVEPEYHDVRGEPDEVWIVTAWLEGCCQGVSGVFDSEKVATEYAAEGNYPGSDYGYGVSKEKVHATYTREAAKAAGAI
jgi:hypothetical protein